MSRLVQWALVAWAAAALIFGTSAASAATVSLEDGVLRIADDASEHNAIYLSPPGDRGPPAAEQIVVRSVDGPLTEGPGCVKASSDDPVVVKELYCTRSEHLRLDIHLGGSSDGLFGNVEYDSGRIDGGPGNDLLSMDSAGSDEIIGGEGHDVVAYGYSDVGISGSMDGQPNDGAPGERDNIHTDVEALHGGFGPDHLYGSDANDSIYGNSGDDVIVGGGGDDSLDGGYGADQLYGGAGQDQLGRAEGKPFQSPDTLDCGSDYDYAGLDELDTTTGCENGQYTMGPGTWWSSPPPADTPPPAWMPPLMPTPTPSIAPSGTVNRKAGIARVTTRCRSTTDMCQGRLTLRPAKRADKRQIGSAQLRVARGSTKRVAVQLTGYGRRVLKRRHKLRAVAVLTPISGGSTSRTSVVLTVVG